MSWNAFKSVDIDSMASNIDKIDKPNFSEEQLEELNYKILDAYNSQQEVEISIFKNGNIEVIKSKIKKLNSYNNTILLSNKQTIIFSQIVDIKLVES